MRDGQPSATAQRVAAFRRGFDRPQAPFGDPAAEDRLADNVMAGLPAEWAASAGPGGSAGPAEPGRDERMARYLQARTAFFDQVVLRGLDRGAAQMLVIGAGYDGRSLRYAKPGVRWFEVDHPATQQDKRARLERLDIPAGHVTFVPADLREPGLADALVMAGFEPDAPVPVICEGVATYLDAADFARLLAELRAVATAGTRLAFSSALPQPAGGGARERFAGVVAGLGEPARSALSGAQVARMLARARWRPVTITERAQQLGFVVAAPQWVAAEPPAPATAGRTGRYLERTFSRAGTASLAGHLADEYGIGVDELHQLDVGVFRADLADGGRWVARVFGADRPVAAARAEAVLLRFLDEAGFPAERCAAEDPVTVHQDQAVLVTGWVPGRKPRPTQATFRDLGDLLGRLHRLVPPPDLAAHPGGAWHHLAQGGPAAEIAAAAGLLAAARPRFALSGQAAAEAVSRELAAADAADGLPCALMHPDVVPVNALVLQAAGRGQSRAGRGRASSASRAAGETPAAGLVLVDWSGAGYGPRLWPLAFLLGIAGRHGPRHADAAAAGYRAHIALEPAELDRLPAVLRTRPLVLDAWSIATGRARPAEVAGQLDADRAAAAQIADRARAILASDGRHPGR